jgi:hypothetical protein
MLLLVLVCLLIPMAFTAVLYFMGVRSRKVLAVPLIAFVLLPVLVVIALYLFRAPIQQGRVLPDLGPVLSLVFPATDLYEPLLVMPLVTGKTEYELAWAHKYVGHHALAVSVPGRSNGMSAMEPKLAVNMEVFEDGDLIFGGGTGRASQYWARDHFGVHLAWYRVPRDLPVGRPLTAVITVTGGDLDGFLTKYPGAELRMVKVSDE